MGVTDTSNYPSLNLGQKNGLVNGANRITVDLTDKTYGSMLYLRNDSTDNAAQVRIEAGDAAEVALGATGGDAAGAGTSADGANPALGTSLGAHPFYEYDPAHPERFWTFVQDIRTYAAQGQAGQAADMTLIQMGDEGSAQFAVSATAMARAYANISSEADAVAYIENRTRPSRTGSSSTGPSTASTRPRQAAPTPSPPRACTRPSPARSRAPRPCTPTALLPHARELGCVVPIGREHVRLGYVARIRAHAR